MLRRKTQQSDYLVAITEHRRDKWDPHTPESFMDIKAALDAVKDNTSELKELEVECGVNYDPNGFLWDPYLSQLLQIPNCIFWDIQHCLYASGGVAQIEVNGFVLEMLAHGITLVDLDTFAARAKGHKLKRDFSRNGSLPTPTATSRRLRRKLSRL